MNPSIWWNLFGFLFLFCKINVCLQALSCSASTHFYDRWLIFLLWLDSLHLLPFKSTKSLEIPSLALRIRFSRWFEAICRTTWEISKRKLFTRLTNKFSFRYLHCKWLVDFLTTLWCASQSYKVNIFQFDGANHEVFDLNWGVKLFRIELSVNDVLDAIPPNNKNDEQKCNC